MQKNVASQKLIVFAFDSTTNLPKTGDAANITAYVSIDYGAVTVLGDTSATEMDATNAKGYYLFDLTQAETNGNTLLFSAKSTTSNIVVIGVPATVFTDPPNYPLTSIDGNGRLDIIKIAGTSQTARDIGASVLLSAGTGAGQLDFTSGVVKANLAQILGTALTETAGQLAGGFKKFFNIATPAATMDHGILVDTVTALTNAPTVGDFTATMKTSLITAASASSPTLDWSKVTNQSSVVVLSNTLISEVVNVNNILAGGITTASFASGAPLAAAQSNITFASLTVTGAFALEGGTTFTNSTPGGIAVIIAGADGPTGGIGLDISGGNATDNAGRGGDGVDISGGNGTGADISGSGCGMFLAQGANQGSACVGNASLWIEGSSSTFDAAPNGLITGLYIAGNGGFPAAILNGNGSGPALTGLLPDGLKLLGDSGNGGSDIEANIDGLTMTESYAALGATPSPVQAIFEVRGILAEGSVSGTTMTVRGIDGTTPKETFALNSSTAPSSITRLS